MPAKPKAKKTEPPPSADNCKHQASNAAKQPIKQPCQGINQKDHKPENAEEEEEEEEGDDNDNKGDSAPWAEVEEKAILKGKVRGPVRG